MERLMEENLVAECAYVNMGKLRQCRICIKGRSCWGDGGMLRVGAIGIEGVWIRSEHH